MSYHEFLCTFGHLRRPKLTQAYSVWHGDDTGPESYVRAMRLYEIAKQQHKIYDWCRYVWRAKKVWAAYLRNQTFPLPIAPRVE